MSLTPATVRLWKAIDTYIARYGYPPLQRELSDMLGVKRGSYLAIRLHVLEAEGIIEKVPGRGKSGVRWRGIRLLKEAPNIEALV